MSLKSLTAAIPDSKKKAVKEGSKLNLLPNIPPHIKVAVSDYIIAQKEAKEAKEKAEKLGEVIIDHSLTVQTEEGLNNRYQKSYLVSGQAVKSETPYVQYSRSDRFSDIKDEKVVSSLKKTLGVATFNRLFEKDLTLQIAPEVFKNKELVKELASLLTSAFGDRLGEFFQKEEKWVAKDGLDVSQFSLGTTPKERKDNYEFLQTEVKQNRPALKLT